MIKNNKDIISRLTDLTNVRATEPSLYELSTLKGHTHLSKLKILKTAMENFQHGKGKNFPLDSMRGRMFEADLYKVDELLIGGKDILTKEEMLEMNMLFKMYK